MIPSSDRFDQPTIAQLLEVDPLVQDDRAFFALFDWSLEVEPGDDERRGPGRPGHLKSASLKTLTKCDTH